VRIVLDTHVFIWFSDVLGSRNVSERARTAIEDRANEVMVSAASAWEIATKHRLGRLPAGRRIVAQWSDALDVLHGTDLAVTSEHGLMAGGFDADHRDPFDRIIAAQAIIEGAQLITADPAMHIFGADILW
jgi:PIN domain nuclease of toxin-antitoxin system